MKKQKDYFEEKFKIQSSKNVVLREKLEKSIQIDLKKQIEKRVQISEIYLKNKFDGFKLKVSKKISGFSEAQRNYIESLDQMKEDFEAQIKKVNRLQTDVESEFKK